MKLTCKCGAVLDAPDDHAASHARNAFYEAHAICLQPEQHVHQHLNLDESFWLNTFAGAAMQGQLASLNTPDAIMLFNQALEERKVDYRYPERLIAINAVNYAKALLEEVKKHETQT